MLHLSLFFFNAPPTTETYTLSLHDALPIYRATAGGPLRAPDDRRVRGAGGHPAPTSGPDRRGPAGHRGRGPGPGRSSPPQDRKSTRLNSSHANISYAVFCLKKKNKLYKRRL